MNVNAVAKAFNLRFNDGFGELSIADNLGTPIRNLAQLKYAIDVFAMSGCFYLKVAFTQEETTLINDKVKPSYI